MTFCEKVNILCSIMLHVPIARCNDKQMDSFCCWQLFLRNVLRRSSLLSMCRWNFIFYWWKHPINCRYTHSCKTFLCFYKAGNIMLKVLAMANVLATSTNGKESDGPFSFFSFLSHANLSCLLTRQTTKTEAFQKGIISPLRARHITSSLWSFH